MASGDITVQGEFVFYEREDGSYERYLNFASVGASWDGGIPSDGYELTLDGGTPFSDEDDSYFDFGKI